MLASANDPKQALKKSAYNLRYGMHTDHVPDLRKCSFEKLGYTNSTNTGAMMRLLYRQCEAFDRMDDKLRLTKLFTDAFCGPERLTATRPVTATKWWWTSRTILGRTGSMTTFLQDPNQYRIAHEWKSIIIYDCPKKWWSEWMPTPIIFAIVDAAFVFRH